MEFQHGLI